MLKKYAYFIAIAYSLGLAFLCLINLGELPKAPYNSGDKLFHFCAYFILSLLWFNVFVSQVKLKKSPAILSASLLAFVFGIIIELLQSALTSTRASDVYDVLANTVGILLAALVLLCYKNKDVKNS
ncbi:VanZ family protein [Aestuariivivens insulae]|uniref:VanZ family protein n=1 Tax=Aestuariivivens insulae TaxID=1621988 RepID=UPI001F570342|nr:VanZ family protein [Aestuariivivens insulae]